MTTHPYQAIRVLITLKHDTPISRVPSLLGELRLRYPEAADVAWQYVPWHFEVEDAGEGNPHA